MSYENGFEGKSVLVTGAARGIGHAIVVKLHGLGATVFAVSQNSVNLASLKSECPNVQTIAVDLRDWEATREAIEKLPTVDYLVNSAGIFMINSFLDVTKHEFDSVCNINVHKAVINVSQIVAKKMIAAGKPGSIVNVSAVAGLRARPTFCSYSTLKAGLDHLTKIMAIELGPHGIRVNSVNPGAVKTGMFFEVLKQLNPSGGDAMRVASQARIPSVQKTVEVEEVVGTTLFLLSNVAPMITGSNIAIDGGFYIS